MATTPVIATTPSRGLATLGRRNYTEGPSAIEVEISSPRRGRAPEVVCNTAQCTVEQKKKKEEEEDKMEPTTAHQHLLHVEARAHPHLPLLRL
jgi:hypothetical protein